MATTEKTGRIQHFHIPKELLGLAINDRSPAGDICAPSPGETSDDCALVEQLTGPRWSARVERPRPARRPVIIVAMDDSQASNFAAEWATDMGQKMGASVVLVHAIHLSLTPYGPANPAWLRAGLRQEAMTRAEPIMLRAQGCGVPVTCAVEEGAPAEVVIKAARRWQAQAIIMAAPRTSGFLKRLFGGHTVDRVIRDAECPVIVLESARCPAR
jgi:nucleotide-binding universal stress UspA family protein